MNKSELIVSVAKETAMTKKAASEAVEATFSVIQQSLARGEKVTLVGFGTFDVRDRKERKGVNPSTGERITIPATRVPVFKAGKALKEVVKK